MPRPLVATIDVFALQHNLSIARHCAPHAKVWAVVKANAYGHGLGRAMRGFAAADGLALVELDAAVRLREMGWKKPIFLLEGFFEPADLQVLFDYRLETAIHCHEQLDMLAHAKVNSSRAQSDGIDVHLKMNSGMNRLGFQPDAYRAMHARLCALPLVRHISLMTHFANAEQPDNHGMPFAQQMQRFHDAANGLPGQRSLANSAVTLLHPAAAADWVRPGIMLYGASPGGNSAHAFGLRPGMTLTTRLIGIQQIGPGDAVGYGSRFIAERPMRIGVAACGYADGYPRHAPGGTPVLVDGIRAATAGSVSMDMLCIDLSAVPDAAVGSAVTLWGDGLPIDDVARCAGTIGYELMCALAPRVRVVER